MCLPVRLHRTQQILSCVSRKRLRPRKVFSLKNDRDDYLIVRIVCRLGVSFCMTLEQEEWHLNCVISVRLSSLCESVIQRRSLVSSDWLRVEQVQP